MFLKIFEILFEICGINMTAALFFAFILSRFNTLMFLMFFPSSFTASIF